MTTRRDVLRGLVALAGAAGLRTELTKAAPSNPLVGIQMGPHTMLDEGIEPCLDLIRETAAIDTLFTYSHAYGGDLRKPVSWLATDHGKPPLDQRNRKLPLVWVRHHDHYFRDTALRHQTLDASFEFAKRDLFAEMVAPAARAE